MNQRRALHRSLLVDDGGEAVGAEHTGIRIFPEHNIQGVLEPDRADVTATYTALVDGIADLKPAYP